MPKTTIKAKTVDLGELELGDKLYVVLELEVMDEGRRRNGTADTVDYRGAVIKDVLRLAGALPTELADELRRQRREAEEEATGIPVVPGLEGFLDSGGVVITEADRGITTEELEADEVDAVARWLDLGAQVHQARETAAGEGTQEDRADAIRWLEDTLATLNDLAEGDIIDHGLVIDDEGNEREVLELPDFDPADFEDIEPERALDEPPFEGYDGLDFDGIIGHVDAYLVADRDLGGPSAKALSYVETIHRYEECNGGRPKVVAALADRVAIVGAELALLTGETVETTLGLALDAALGLAAPWETYDKDSADAIIARLRGEVETDVDEGRRLIAIVDAYELAHKARKGVLNRIGGLAPPPLPAGPDDDLELDDDDDDDDVDPLVARLDDLDENTTDDELEEEFF